MQIARRWWIASLTASTLFLLCGLTPSAASVRPTASPAPPGLSWHSCDTHYRCASLAVPLDYSDPHDGTLNLALVELPSTSRQEVGDIVMNPGGPGASGIQFLEGSSFPAALRSSFNLVSFDPRGVGASDPVQCAGAATIRSLVALDPSPVTSQQITEDVRATKAFDQACAAHTSHALLANVGTGDTVRDLDRIRAALGQATLNYVGFSYGTYIGELYAEEYPTRLRAMVLDGVFDPALSVATEDAQQAAGFELDLHDFFAWCPTNKTCTGELPAGAQASYDRLVGSLEHGGRLTANLQAKYGGVQQVTLGIAELAVAGTLYSSSTWPDLAQGIQQGLTGNGGLLAAIAYSYEGLMSNGQYSNILAANTAISCADRAYPTTLSFYEALAPRLATSSPDFGASEAWGSLSCAYWPFAPEGTSSAVHVTKGPPVLLIGSTGDPATPYSWAQDVAKQFAHGVLLTRDGPGHTGYFNSTCIQGWADRYLVTLTLPPSNTICQSNS